MEREKFLSRRRHHNASQRSRRSRRCQLSPTNPTCILRRLTSIPCYGNSKASSITALIDRRQTDGDLGRPDHRLANPYGGFANLLQQARPANSTCQYDVELVKTIPINNLNSTYLSSVHFVQPVFRHTQPSMWRTSPIRSRKAGGLFWCLTSLRTPQINKNNTAQSTG